MPTKKRTTPEALPVKHAPPGKHARKDDGNAFFPDPGNGPAHTTDGLAQELAEEFLSGARSGEQIAEDTLNAEVPEEEGGPWSSRRRARSSRMAPMNRTRRVGSRTASHCHAWREALSLANGQSDRVLSQRSTSTHRALLPAWGSMSCQPGGSAGVDQSKIHFASLMERLTQPWDAGVPK